MKLIDFINLFLDGNDDKIYIDLYNGNDFDEIFNDVRIIHSKLKPFYNREIIALSVGYRINVILNIEESGNNVG